MTAHPAAGERPTPAQTAAVYDAAITVGNLARTVPPVPPQLLGDLRAALDCAHTAATRPARIRMSRALRDRLAAGLAADPRRRFMPAPAPGDQLLGLPVVVDDTLEAGEWRLVDHAGRTVAHGGRPRVYYSAGEPLALLVRRIDQAAAERLGMTAAELVALRLRPPRATPFRITTAT